MCKKGFWVKSLWVKSMWGKSLWVKNHWGKIGVDGMLAFVPPFSGVLLYLRNLQVSFSSCLPLMTRFTQVSCKLRNAEYNPRKGLHRMHLRLLKPATDATVWSKGTVHCCVKARHGKNLS